MVVPTQQRRDVQLRLFLTHHPEWRHGLLDDDGADSVLPSLRGRRALDADDGLVRRPVQKTWTRPDPERVRCHSRRRNDRLRDQPSCAIRRRLPRRLWMQLKCANHSELHAQ